MTTTENNQTIRPFTVTIDQAEIDDLRRRLDHTRFAPAAPGDSWDYGTPTAYLRDMVERWKSFDWREVEARINAHPNYLTEIDGQTIHFVHVKSAVPGARALLLAHTYPGSFLEFLPLIGPLTDAGFDLVIPSMPGFGFSTPVVDGGWTMARVARAYDELMRGLGYASYGVHGSDGGAMVGRELAILDPEGFLGAHVLQLFSFPSGDPAEFEGFGPKEYAALEHMQWFQSVGGYNAMNGSRPQTVAAGLSDSPVGQLAYSELFESFGNGTSLVTPEQVLEQVTLYWLTNTAAGSVRYHYEEAHAQTNDRPSRWSAPVASASPSSRTTSRRSGRWPSGTTRTSSTGRSSTAVATSPCWRTRTRSSVTCARSSGAIPNAGRQA